MYTKDRPSGIHCAATDLAVGKNASTAENPGLHSLYDF